MVQTRKYIGIVFSTSSKMPRRVIIENDGAKIPDINAHIGVGESAIISTIVSENADQFVLHPQRLRKIIAKYHGISPLDIPDDQCAVLCRETGLVKDLVRADPEYDLSTDGHVVAATASVGIGDKYDGTEFLFRHAVVMNDQVYGFIWDTYLQQDLVGMAVRDLDCAVGDNLDIPELINHSSEGVEEL